MIQLLTLVRCHSLAFLTFKNTQYLPTMTDQIHSTYLYRQIQFIYLPIYHKLMPCTVARWRNKEKRCRKILMIIFHSVIVPR